jgi:hypothetical protein
MIQIVARPKGARPCATPTLSPRSSQSGRAGQSNFERIPLNWGGSKYCRCEREKAGCVVICRP